MSIDVSTPVFEVVLPPALPNKADREHQAFARLLPQLLQTHAGQFVAIHDEKVVDHDADDIAVVERVHRRFGYVPIFVGRVESSATVVRIPHYRAYRPRGDGA